MDRAFVGVGRPLSNAGLIKAASDIGVVRAALWAVITVETKGCGFLPDRRPQILFERHIFHRRTAGRFDATAPDISNATAGGYGSIGAQQYLRLERAMALDRNAALESASWGLGQVMGFNARLAGYPDAESMVKAMCESEDLQFQAMTNFIVASNLSQYLQTSDWTSFAARYNGPGYKENRYDEKLAQAYARYQTGPMPDLDLRATQLYLSFLGYQSGPVDGVLGRNTKAALNKYQGDRGLVKTGNIDPVILEAIKADVAALSSEDREE